MTSASSYGAIDNTDIRRLSFISFADVVLGEHAGSSSSVGVGVGVGGLPSPSSPARNRSPSPLRSPGSSSSFQPFQQGSARSSLYGTRSPVVPLGPDALLGGGGGAGAGVGGDLVMETMRNAMDAVGTAELHEVVR
jgi:hypothetical protein